MLIKKGQIISFLLAFAILMQYSGSLKIVSATLMYLLFIGLSFILFIKNDFKISSYSRIYLISLLAYIFYLLISLMISPSKDYGSYKFLMTTIFIFVALAVVLNSYYSNFHYSFFFTAVIIVLFIYFNYGSPFELAEEASIFYRLGNEDDKNPIILARGLGFSIITLSFIQSGVKWKTGFKYLVIIIAFVYMVFSGSKGPVFSLIIALGYVLWIRQNGKLNYKRIIFIGVFSTFFFSLLINSNTFENSLVSNRFLDNTGSYDSRLDQYELVLNGIQNFNFFEWFIGKGLGSYAILAYKTDIRIYPHNLTLELLYETGIIGLLIFFIIVIMPIFKLTKLDKQGRYYLAVLIYYFINAQFTGDLMANALIFVFAAMVIYSLKYSFLNHDSNTNTQKSFDRNSAITAIEYGN